MAKGPFPLPVTTDDRTLEEPVGQLLGAPMSRRSVVAAAAWSVPAVSLASATPAFANTSQATNVTISGPSGGVPASGAVPVTVTVKDAQGQPQAGQPVSFSGPDGSSFDAADGVTNGAGQYTAKFNNNKPWAKPGSTIAVTAVSGSGNASQSFAVLGSNVLGWGSGTFGVTGLGSVANTSSPSQLMQVFPAPVVQVAQGGDYFTLFRLADGTVWGVGRNSQGQLADGTTNDVYWPPQRVPGLSNVVDVAAGYQTGYAVLQDGTVRSWGVNANSALGDGSTYSSKSYSTSVVTVQGVSGAVKVAGGSWFGLALLSNGTVAGWGRNGFGQLGDTTNGDRATATTAVGVSGATDIAATSVAGYALLGNGTIMAWGGNWKGQQGDGSTLSGNRYTPAAVSGISTATSLGAAWQTGYAILSDKTVMAWGDGENGELGNGASAASAAPVAVQGLTNVVQVGAGYALTDDGAVYAWGPNDAGQLGNGSSSGSNVPVAVTVPAGIPIQAIGGSDGANARYIVTGEMSLTLDVTKSQISAGSSAAVLATVSSGAKLVQGVTVDLTATGNAALGAASGQTNASGVFETWVTPDPWTVPGAQLRVSGATDAATSMDSYTVLGANALAFGRETGYELGDQGANGPQSGTSSVSRTTPTQLSPAFPSPIKQIAGTGWGDSFYSYNNTFALLQDGTVWTVGGNYAGQSGDGSQYYHAGWTQIPGLANVTQISTANLTIFALLANGKVMGWGDNFFGQIGTGTPAQGSSGVPIEIAGLSNVTKVSSGSQTTYFLLQDQTVWSLGRGGAGLGTGNSNEPDASTPVQVTGLSSVIDIAGRAGGGYALKSDGTVWAWGANYSGALGSGTSPVPPRWSQGVPEYSSATPVQVTGLSGKTVTAIAGRADGGLALTSDGAVYAWGDNQSGTVGDGTTTSRSVATLVSGMASDVARIYCSGLTSYAIKNDGSSWAWGDNSFGQLGNGSTNNSSTPVAISGLGGKYVTSFMTDAPTPWRQYAIVGPSTVTVNTASTQLTAGQATVVQAKVAAGSQGVSGATVTVTATGTATISTPSGQTDSSGLFETSVTPDQWSRPGSVVRLTAASEASSGQKTLATLGANAMSIGYGLWGSNGTGTWGPDNLTATQIARTFPSPVRQVHFGVISATALLEDGTVWTVGRNDGYQLGDPSVPLYDWNTSSGGGRNTWGQVPNLPSNIVQIAGGRCTRYALTADGNVWAWGWGVFGAIGDGANTDRPGAVRLTSLSGVKRIGSGYWNGFAIMADDSVMAWGGNTTGGAPGGGGLLGDGTTTNRPAPVAVPGWGSVASIEGDRYQTTVLRTDGSVWMSGGGSGAVGSLGNGSTNGSLVPTQVGGLSNIQQISVGFGFVHAIRSDRSVIGWGTNDKGQIGDGTTTTALSPVVVGGLSNVVELASGWGVGYARRADGSVLAWGMNDSGQLGNGGTTDSLVPVQVTGLSGHTVESLNAGEAGAAGCYFVVS